jgi:hypothetical protein
MPRESGPTNIFIMETVMSNYSPGTKGQAFLNPRALHIIHQDGKIGRALTKTSSGNRLCVGIRQAKRLACYLSIEIALCDIGVVIVTPVVITDSAPSAIDVNLQTASC